MVDNLKAVQYSYCGIIYDKKIQSQVSNSPRGDWYHFVLIRNNKIIAQCEEEGNYADLEFEIVQGAEAYWYSRFTKPA